MWSSSVTYFLEHIFSHIENKLSSRSIQIFHWTLCIILFVFAITLGLLTRPEQISDFQNYWEGAKDFHLYNRSGALLLIYAPFHWLGITSYIAALIVNSICWFSITWALWSKNTISSSNVHFSKLPQLSLSIILLPLGVWFIGMFPLVNSDIPHLSLILLGTIFFLRFLLTKKHSFAAWSIVFITIALSIRSQALPVALCLLGTLGLYTLFSLQKKPNFKILGAIIILFISIVSSRGIHALFVSQSSVPHEVKIMERVTLYTGILSSSCGQWSIEASNATKEDLHLTFLEAINHRISMLSPENIGERLICKLQAIAKFKGFGINWLQDTLFEKERFLHPHYVSVELFSLFRSIEETISIFFKYILMLIIFIPSKTQRPYWYIAMCIFIFYFLQHLLLEIQPRYYIVPLVLPAFIRIVSFFLPKSPAAEKTF